RRPKIDQHRNRTVFDFATPRCRRHRHRLSRKELVVAAPALRIFAKAPTWYPVGRATRGAVILNVIVLLVDLHCFNVWPRRPLSTRAGTLDSPRCPLRMVQVHAVFDGAIIQVWHLQTPT